MPREIITVQIGQCGNQLGLRWWDVMLQESKAHPKYEDARQAVFYDGPNGRLKARCVAVDMEQGVLHSMLRGPLNYLFDSNFFVSDVSGAGNNWAVGHMEYGDQYIESIANATRHQVEQCDCIQAFFVTHSLSGGTGSGLGTRVLGMLEEEFPHVFRISPVVMPSEVDDVVTAPYNACFALKELIEHADGVLPLDNDALARMVDTSLGKNRHGFSGDGKEKGEKGSQGFSAARPTNTKGLPYDDMNGLVAQMMSNLTCAMRFPGPLNMDINEITTNMVPYARLNMLIPSLAPLCLSSKSSGGLAQGARSVDAMIHSCLSKAHQFVDIGGAHSPSSSSSHTSLATALIARGPQITVGDLRRNIQMLHHKLQLPYWNQDGFKTAICGVPPLGHTNSMLMLSNNCGIVEKLRGVYGKFMKLYSVKSHVHHYEEYLTPQYFDLTSEVIQSTMDDYEYLDDHSAVLSENGKINRNASGKGKESVPQCLKDLIYY